MRVAILKSLTAVSLLLLLAAGQASAAETLRIAGTGGALGILRQIAVQSVASTGIQLEIIRGLGSTGAIHAVTDGVIDLAVSTQLLGPELTARGLTAVPLARTAFVFVTSHRKPNTLNSNEITEIYKSTSPKWADGSPITILLRPKSDGDSLILQKLFVGMREAIEAARRRSEIPIAATDQDNAQLAERLPGSFTTAGLSQIETEKRNLRFVPIDGVEPSLAALESGKYPYEKIFYLVFSAKNKASAERLLDFMKSEKGRTLLRETGNLPVVE